MTEQDRETLLLAAAQLHAAGQTVMANRLEALASRKPPEVFEGTATYCGNKLVVVVCEKLMTDEYRTMYAVPVMVTVQPLPAPPEVPDAE